ncbi:phage tail protein [Azospirillum brasilense]|nr:phage tail protein [Azospirillum brasilense]
MADTSRRLAGIAYITVDGTTYMLAADAAYNPSNINRETLNGMDGVHGYKESPRAGFIEGTFRDAGDLIVASINALTNVTVVIEAANGKIICGRNMWQVGDLDVNLSEGTFKTRFEGPQVEEA